MYPAGVVSRWCIPLTSYLWIFSVIHVYGVFSTCSITVYELQVFPLYIQSEEIHVTIYSPPIVAFLTQTRYMYDVINYTNILRLLNQSKQ